MKKLLFGLTTTAALLASAGLGYGFSSFGDAVDQYCAPETPFAGDCNLCHSSSTAKNAYKNGDLDYFCPPPPPCPDADNDGYTDAACGGTDCNDDDPAINPGAAENCTDGIDNNCNDQIDTQDGGAVGCPPVCTDLDGDGFAVEGGDCGPVDCDDHDGGVYPGAAEICTDGIDNNCSGLIDGNEPSCAPACTDLDGDGFAVEGGDCGPVDCDDAEAAVYPGAAEICADGIDNDCNGLSDGNEPACAPVCTDLDGDGFAVEGGGCGPVDCDDTDDAVHPAAAESCTDGIDNNCSGLIDTQDPAAVDCPTVCTDLDGDGYAIEGGDCGPIDCSDDDASIYPGAEEFCDDGVDSDCDGQIDEGCDPACPDADGDGYLDATCGGIDCDDTEALINPGAAETCGNAIDENCNGMSDDECLACPDGGMLSVKKAEYDPKKGRLKLKGRSHLDTTISVEDAATGEMLADGIRVKGGKWKVKIKDLDALVAPQTITAINSDGCFADHDVSMKRTEHGEDDDNEDDEDHDHDDDDDDDHEEHDRKEREHKKSWKHHYRD